MRNDSTCLKCKSIRSYFGDSVDLINTVDCDENSDQCIIELESYRDDRRARTPSGTITEAVGYPTAVIGDTAYVGITPSALKELTGCE